MVSGGLSGNVSIVALLRDGTLYREASSQRGGSQVPRSLIRKLSAREVQSFEKLLAQQRFPNLDRMRYLNETVLFDSPTTRLEAPGIQVDYVDLALSQVPRGLRNIVNAWNQISNE